MDERPENIDEGLERIARATASIRPGAGFNQRVLRAVTAERDAAYFRRALVRAGRLMVAAGALLAVGTLVVAAVSREKADEAVAVTYGVEEIEW